MTGPFFIERAPQVLSLATGALGLAAALLWRLSVPLGVILGLLAVATFALRIWIPRRRRRKYGF